MRWIISIFVVILTSPALAFTPALYEGNMGARGCKTTKTALTQTDGSTLFPSSHASTIIETPDGLHAAWFSGSGEGNEDVVIMFSSRNNGQWSDPKVVATGKTASGERYPTWNPVLHYNSADKSLDLYYKVGPSPQIWWGLVIRSKDAGSTWSKPLNISSESRFLGPIKNKGITMADGSTLFPSSIESKSQGRISHIERVDGTTGKIEFIEIDHSITGNETLQPTLLAHSNDKVQLLARDRHSGTMAESWSMDGGKTWAPMKWSQIPNPQSGLDGVVLKDGRTIVAHNLASWKLRNRLGISISEDQGKTWRFACVIEESFVPWREYSYPAVIQTEDGQIHITYTDDRKYIMHSVMTPEDL